jgi:hypothetical protein
MDRWTERFTSDGEKAIAIHDGSDFPDVCFEGEREYDVMNALAEYEDLEEQGSLVKLSCKVGDTVYVDSAILPIEDMECYEDIDNKIPSYFQGRVVSFRFAKRNWVKIAVKAKWLYEWIDDETGPESNYIECEKSFSILLSTIGKTVFLAREEAGGDSK